MFHNGGGQPAPDAEVRVLLIEDNPGDARLVREMLAEAGGWQCQLAHAERAADAAQLLADGEFDVILLDLSLPDVSGSDTVARVVRAAPQLPVVVLTGTDDERLAMEAVHYGAQDYLVKGQISAELLVRSVRYAIERKRSELRLSHLAQYDQLTGLPNRALFRERLERALAHAQRHRRLMALMFLDLDHFKDINDTLGHEAGDELLKAVAKRLGRCIRREDTVARMGGDEFTVILEEIASKDDAAAVAQKICTLMTRAFNIDGRDVYIGASVGIALYPGGGGTPAALIKQADVALYAVKKAARGSYQFFEKAMNAEVARRLSAVTSLRRAVERQEFELHYQPQFDLETGRLAGMEALLRWRHPERGLVNSGQFVGLLEEKGLVGPVGDWVLRTACEQNRQWQRDGRAAMPVGINLSPRQFRQRTLVEQVDRVLQETGLDPKYLQLEVTEAVLIDANAYVPAMLADLRALGVRLSIDGFGASYSSLVTLRQFPFETLKLAPSFVQELAADRRGAAIISAVIALAHTLDLRVVAVGVELQQQVTALAKGGCDMVQGFLYSNPMPAAEFSHWLAKHGGVDGQGRPPTPA